MTGLRSTLPGLLLLAAAAVPGGMAQESRATVLSIGDGDTIRVQQGSRRITVRLACIDAPEMAQAPYGDRARAYLQTRLPIGSAVTLRTQTVDRFGRTVAEVIAAINLNLAMVEDGQAFAYRQFLSQCDGQAYLDAEVWASRRRMGVWQVPGGITRPWDFRRGRAAARRVGDSGSTPAGRRDLDCDGDGEAAKVSTAEKTGNRTIAPLAA